MRIISGKFKATKLETPLDKYTRPLKDIVKESIFNFLFHSNKINFQIKSSIILDLYSGSGSFGIECISRGTSKVFFVENDEIAMNNLKSNLKILNIINKSSFYLDDVMNFLDKFKLKNKIDLVFLDPPYMDSNYINVIKLMKKKDFLKKKHLLVIHREKNTSKNLGKNLNILENRVYGRSEIFFGNFFG